MTMHEALKLHLLAYLRGTSAKAKFYIQGKYGIQYHFFFFSSSLCFHFTRCKESALLFSEL